MSEVKDSVFFDFEECYQEIINDAMEWCDPEVVTLVMLNDGVNDLGWESNKAFFYGLEAGYDQRHLSYLTKYPVWKSGTKRVAYFDTESGRVHKVPLSRIGEEASMNEDARAAGLPVEDMEDVPVAPCFLDGDVLIMDIVEPVRGISDICPHTKDVMIECSCDHCYDLKDIYPAWVFLVDAGQVGYTKNGELVAYDM